MYPTLSELKERSQEREYRKTKLKEALKKERITHPDEYKIESKFPLGSSRIDVARKIITKMNEGTSVLVLTLQMAQMMCKELKKNGNIGTYKKEDDGYRVWKF